MENDDRINSYLANIENVLLVRDEKTEDIVLIYEVDKKMACILEEPNSPECFNMVSKLKDCGARIVSSITDIVGSGNDAPLSSLEERRIARRLEKQRKRKSTS